MYLKILKNLVGQKMQLILILLLVQGCSAKIPDSYRIIGAELQKQHNLTAADLIITYDLAKINKNNCIYAQDLGVILNNKKCPKQYMQKFNRNFKHPVTLRKEALNKVAKISRILLQLQTKYSLLSSHQYNYIKRLAESDLSKIDPKKELHKLNAIIVFIPLLLPEYKALITSRYGNRFHPIEKKRKFHCGSDLVSVKNSPIFASANGKVIFAGKKNGYGNIVEIMHRRDLVSKYAHLNNIYVHRGQKVMRGTAIASQGCSGNASADHLHFEIWLKGSHVDPYDFIGLACKCQKN